MKPIQTETVIHMADYDLVSCSFDYESVTLLFERDRKPFEIRVSGFIHVSRDIMWDECITESLQIRPMSEDDWGTLLPRLGIRVSMFESGSPSRNQRSFNVYVLRFIDGSALTIIGGSAERILGGVTTSL